MDTQEGRPAGIREAVTLVLLLAAAKAAVEKLKDDESGSRKAEAVSILEVAIHEAEKT